MIRMTSLSVFDLFSVGIGPSSSHTVGPMKAAREFALGLQQNGSLTRVRRITAAVFGSLGATGKGHGTPGAIMLGLEGEKPESVLVDQVPQRLSSIRDQQQLKLLNSHIIVFQESTDIIMHGDQSLRYHPNGMIFSAYDKKGLLLAQQQYYSVGGGFVVDDATAQSSKLVENNRPQKFAFTSAAQLLALCQQHQITIAELMWQNEVAWRPRRQIEEGLLSLWDTMQQCVLRGIHSEGVLPGGLNIPRRAPQLYQQLTRHPDADASDPLSSMDWVTLYALAVNEENAAGGRIVTAPTNGAAGIIPAVLHYYWRFVAGANVEKVQDFLLTAAAIGILYKTNASISGADVGCQGEVGSACSMAAGGLTAVMGGTPLQVENAAEIAMEHNLGLTCDPVGGLVQVPCIERNAMAAIKAIHASRMALSGDGSHFVSLDKVIKTMRDTGKDMKEKYKETSRGGLAVNVVEVPVSVVDC